MKLEKGDVNPKDCETLRPTTGYCILFWDGPTPYYIRLYKHSISGFLYVRMSSDEKSIERYDTVPYIYIRMYMYLTFTVMS